MEEIHIKDLEQGSYYSEPLFLDDAFILNVPEAPVSKALISLLADWGCNSVRTSGTKRAFDESLNKKNAAYLDSEEENTKYASDLFNDMVEYMTALFSKLSSGGKIHYADLAAKVHVFIRAERDARRYFLQVQQEVNHTIGDYMPTHVVRSLVIAIAVGLQLKMPDHKLIELGAATLMHEIGVVKLSERIRDSVGKLTDEEQKIMMLHPEIGYNILKINNFPLVVSNVALEHHERENGTGYPRKLAGAEISPYSKIVSVVCSYEAITANRPFKEARNGFEGIIDILKNEGKRYDETVIKALVRSVSVYPIGTMVLLSNGKKGRVIDANPESPRFPIVVVLEEGEKTGKTVVETSQNAIQVVRMLNKEEIVND